MGAEIKMMLALERRHDWRTHLNAYLNDIKAADLVWGKHDCAIGLAAHAIEAMTGVDIASQWRGRYDDAASALRMLRKDGFADLEALGRSLLPAVPPAMAQIGDIALVPNDSELAALGVVIGDRIMVLAENGIGSVDLLQASVVFRVG